MDDTLYDIARDFYMVNLHSMLVISKELHVPVYQLRKRFQKDGILRKSNDARCKVTPEVLERAVAAYHEGLSLTKIAHSIGVAESTLGRHFRAKNIKVINRQNIARMNENIFQIIDTEEKAYWLGFLYADGNVYKNRLTLCLKSTDKEHLIKFKRFLAYEGTLEYRKCLLKKTGKEYESYSLSFNNKKIADDLKRLGCVERKSLVLTFPCENNLPKYFHLDFIRGYIDGDGYIGWNEKKNAFRLGIVGTHDVLQNIANKLDLRIGKIQEKGNIFQIEWGGKYLVPYLEKLYGNANIYLDRKFKIYDNYKFKSKYIRNFTGYRKGNADIVR